MNTQEREQLSAFLAALRSARVDYKDDEAAALIEQAARQQPDAAYLLVQKAFLQEQALRQSQAQIEQLQAELARLRSVQPDKAFSDANQWGNAFSRPAAPPPSAPLAPTAAAAPASSWGSGWLGNVATTAAGVVAGSFLFQGIEHLMGHRDSNSLFGGNHLPGQSGETNVVNNFFESDAGSGGLSDLSALDDGLSGDDDTSWL